MPSQFYEHGTNCYRYSVLKACDGLVEASRCAGMTAAAAAAGQCQGGDGEHGEAHAPGFVELRFNIADAKPRYGNSDGYEANRGLEHGAAHDHTDNGAAVCAQGRADTDLGGAADYRVGGHTIEAEGREHKSQE